MSDNKIFIIRKNKTSLQVLHNYYNKYNLFLETIHTVVQTGFHSTLPNYMYMHCTFPSPLKPGMGCLIGGQYNELDKLITNQPIAISLFCYTYVVERELSSG